MLNFTDVLKEVILAKLVNADLLIKLNQLELAKEKLLEIRSLRHKFNYFSCV